MWVGVLTPWWLHGYGYDTVVRIAAAVEELRFDVLWFADHLAVPATRLEHLHTTWFDVLTLMANIAARTTRIRLGTNVLVAPYRHPVLAAKMLATVDVVSGGRLIVGAGTGFLPEEFDTLGMPYFRDRGAYTTECIRVWRSIWTGDVPFKGRFVQVGEILVEPRPAQRPYPPVWIGNVGERVLRRAVEVGDGWHPAGITLAELEQGKKRLAELCQETGRADEPVISFGGSRGRVGGRWLRAEPRALLSGSVEQVTEDLVRLRDLGCASVLFRLGTDRGESLERFLDQLETLATQVLPGVL